MKRLTSPHSSVTLQEIRDAHSAWGFNCGPAAIAAMLGLKPEAVKDAITGFRVKGFSNPTMMRDGISHFGCLIDPMAKDRVFPEYGVMRVQFHGSWMDKGVPEGARYARTHWVGTMEYGTLQPGMPAQSVQWIYDINSGWQSMRDWQRIIVPILTDSYPKCDGGWNFTHKWEIVFP